MLNVFFVFIIVYYGWEKLFEASQSKETELHRGQISKVFSFSTLVGFLKYVLM